MVVLLSSRRPLIFSCRLLGGVAVAPELKMHLNRHLLGQQGLETDRRAEAFVTVPPL